MKTKELVAVVEDWRNEDKDRAVIMITSERLEGEEIESRIMIKGNKGNVLMALFKFMEKQTDMMEEATKIGILNKLIGGLTENIQPEQLDKNKDALLDLLNNLEKLHTKKS